MWWYDQTTTNCLPVPPIRQNLTFSLFATPCVKRKLGWHYLQSSKLIINSPNWLIWQVDNADSQPKSLLWSKIVTQPHQKQMAKFWQFFQLKFWRYCSSFTTENSVKRFRTLIWFNRSTFLCQKMDPHWNQLVNFAVNFHVIGKVFIQEPL